MVKSVTIYQIAKESGVSVSTVSRVLNGNPSVSPRTLSRVKEVIERYQYSPSSVARAMAINQTKTLGVVMPDISNPYFSALFLEIERYALSQQYSIVLCNTLFGGSSHGVVSPFMEAEYFLNMIKHGVDGVIITGGEIDKEQISGRYAKALNHLAERIPVVILGQTLNGSAGTFLNRNLGGGFSTLVRHLVALGNTRIAFVGGEPGIYQTTARLEAYKTTLQGLRLSCDEAMVELSDYYPKDGYSAMKKLLEKDRPLPHAVVSINDAVAVGAIRAINDAGLSCPLDIAIVSGDQFLDSDYITPRLTSLDQQNDYLGRMAIMTLIGAINGDTNPVEISHNPRLVIRESCGSQLNRDFNKMENGNTRHLLKSHELLLQE